MKIRAWKANVHKALLWYTSKLQEAHMGLLTPALVEIMRRDLNALQQKMLATETNPIWKIPVGIHVVPENNYFEVVVTDESNVCYLDAE